MNTTHYALNGLTCSHCVKHVTEEVSQLAGVTKVDISLTDSTMTITSQGALDFEAVKAAVEEAGEYEVTESKP